MTGVPRDAQGPDTDPATATLVIATIRGLLLDLLATGDRVRVQNAAESLLGSLEHKAQLTTPMMGTVTVVLPCSVRATDILSTIDTLATEK